MSEYIFINLGRVFLALPFFLAIACVVVWLRRPKSVHMHMALGRASIAVSLILLVISGWMVWALNSDHTSELCNLIRSPGGWTHAFGIWEDNFSLDVHIDALSLFFIVLANIVAVAASWISAFQTRYDAFHSRFSNPAFFHACLNGFHFTMLLVPILDNLIFLWIAIELTTLSSALVVGFSRYTLRVGGGLEVPYHHVCGNSACIVGDHVSRPCNHPRTIGYSRGAR